MQTATHAQDNNKIMCLVTQDSLRQVEQYCTCLSQPHWVAVSNVSGGGGQWVSECTSQMFCLGISHGHIFCLGDVKSMATCSALVIAIQGYMFFIGESQGHMQSAK